jgi:hypothetical protein
MERNISIVVGAAIIAAALVFIFRWEVTAAGSTMVRLDRWSGEMVGCNVENQMFVDANSLGLPVHYRGSDLTENEIQQNRIDRGRR